MTVRITDRWGGLELDEHVSAESFLSVGNDTLYFLHSPAMVILLSISLRELSTREVPYFLERATCMFFPLLNL